MNGRIYDEDGASPTVRANSGGHNFRRLTEREDWRLMGFSDKDFDRAAAVVSNTQLQKQAGNSIVVDVLMAIFGLMF